MSRDLMPMDELKQRIEQAAAMEMRDVGEMLAQMFGAPELQAGIERTQFDDAARKLAKERYADDDLNIDEDAELNYAEDGTGVWVGAWVWVPHADVEESLKRKEEAHVPG